MTHAPSAAPPVRPRRRGRRLVVLIVVLVVLAGMLVGGDQLARGWAQQQVAQRVQARLQTPATPTVRIGGPIFLTQAAAGRFDDIQVTATQAKVSIGGQDLTVDDIDATAYDVVATQRFQRIVAGRGELHAVLPYASAARLTGLDLDSAGDGKVRVRFEIPISSLTVTGTATGRPQLDEAKQQLTFDDVSVSLGNSQDVKIADAVGQIVLAPIPLNQVPYGLRLTAVSATDQGIAVSGTGRDLPLRTP